MTNTKYSPDTKITVMGTNFFPSRESDREFQLTDTDRLDKVVEQVQK